MHRVRACCFTGHRPKDLPRGGDESTQEMRLLKLSLMQAVQRAVAEGITVFYAGGALGFDLLASEAVLRLKEDMPNLSLHLALPFPKEPGWDEAGLRTRRILEEADEITYQSQAAGQVWAYHARNRYMVDHAELVIAYLAREAGGTYQTVEYAKKKGIPVKNLAENIAAGDRE